MKHTKKPAGKPHIARTRPFPTKSRTDFQRLNLIDSNGNVADAPTTTYLLMAQHFEADKDIEWLQDVELSYDEYHKLRHYLADIRGLFPVKKLA
jgi:hypothetical protein